MVARPDSLPHWPRLLSRELAAAYCGVSLTIFEELVSKKKLPKSKRFPDVRRALWDRVGLDDAIDRLRDDPPVKTEGPPDDDIDAQEAAWEKHGIMVQTHLRWGPSRWLGFGHAAGASGRLGAMIGNRRCHHGLGTNARDMP